MSILRIATPDWVNNVQRTVIPSSALMPRQGAMGAQPPQVPAGQGQSRDPRDKVPAMLRRGEEVITPEVKEQLGGREGMMQAFNQKLALKGLQIKPTRPPVGDEQTEQQMNHGTMDVSGYARGTAMIQPQPSYYPGGLMTDLNTNNLGQNMPYGQRSVLQQQQQRAFSGGTCGLSYKGPRQGYALGTTTIQTPKQPGVGAPANPTTNTGTVTPTVTTTTPSGTPTTGSRDLAAMQQAQNLAQASRLTSTGVPAPDVNPPESSGGSPTITSPVTQGTNPPATTTPTTNTGNMWSKIGQAAQNIIYNQQNPVGTVASPIATTTTPGTTPAPALSPGTTGAGYTVQPLTQSAYFKQQEQAAREALQQQGGVAAMQQAQNLAQQGVGQNTAAGRTAAAEQAAGTSSNIAGMETQLAQTAQAQAQSDLRNNIQLAMQTGDWAGVNSALTASGQQPINFTNLENARIQGNLMGVSNDMMTLATQMASSNIPGAGDLAKVLSDQATTLRVQAYNTVASTSFDPSAITTASQNLASGNFASPQAAAIVNVVYPVIEGFANTDPAAATFFQDLTTTANGSALLNGVSARNPQAVSELGKLTTLAFNMRYGTLTDADIATLKQYGAYRDYSALPRATAEQETMFANPSSGYVGS
jgi:hypothetical protein